MPLVETAAPEAEPLTLEEVKLHLRVTTDAEDDLIAALILAARQACESYTGLALITRGYSLFLDDWCSRPCVELPKPPLAAVSAVYTYAADNSTAVFPADSYLVDAVSRPARVVLTGAPPVPGKTVNGIEFRYTAGFGDAPEDVPEGLREGMKRLVAQMYMHRGDGEDGALEKSGAQSLFQSYRLMRLA